MKRIKIIFITVVACFSLSATAKSPEPVGQIITQSADLVFKSPGNITLEIFPGEDLKAGKYPDKTRVGSYKVESSVLSKLGVRFTPGTGKIDNINKIIVKGKNDASHTLSLTLEPTDPFISAKGWLITKDMAMFFFGNIKVRGDQVVQPDTYTVSMDASFFAS